MVSLIIFDWDDVFTLGSTRGYYKCYHEALKSVGVYLGEEEERKRIVAKWGSTQEEELKELLRDKAELLPQAIKAYERHLHGNTFIDCLDMVPGSKDLLKRLSRNYKLTIATGLNPELLRNRIMPKFAVPDVFSQIESVYNLDNPGHAKPHPFMLQKIIKEQKVPASNTIMVGDAEGDVRMAKAAGIKVVVVLTGHLTRHKAKNLEADFIVDNVAQLERALSDL